MPGKRPRQIQRTTSMSQLGAAAPKFPLGFHVDAGVPLRGHSCPPKQELGHLSMEPCPEAGKASGISLDMEELANGMVVDSDAGECVSGSRNLGNGVDAGPPSNRGLDVGDFRCMGGHQRSLPQHPRGKESEFSIFRHGRFDSNGSVRPVYFLDICYLCSKLLGQGRDVFIYRGDRAFCSVECRHLQIVADERREKGLLLGASDGRVQVNEQSNANHVETVAAA